MIEIVSHAHARRGVGGGGRGGEEGLNDFKFGTFISRFPSDGAAGNSNEKVNASIIVRDKVTRTVSTDHIF